MLRGAEVHFKQLWQSTSEGLSALKPLCSNFTLY